MRRVRLLLAPLTALLALAVVAPIASAVPPTIGAVWSSEVAARSALLHAEVDPGGKAATYRFDYMTSAAYEANLSAGKEGFQGASKLPAIGLGAVPGTVPTTIGPSLFGLQPDTAYRYRLTVTNADGSDTGPTLALATHPLPGGPLLPDERVWEMVSPVQKNGGQVDPPGALAGGGVLQAAADGQSVTYGSDASFAGGAGAPPASQYVSSRGSGGWSTHNVTPALLSGSYGEGSDGVPYRLFSPDLGRGLLLNGRPCRGQASGCPVANPPLAGTDAPPGYQNYYLRESGAGFEALLGGADVAGLTLDPSEFELTFSGASPDLSHVVLSTCAKLTPAATEVPLGAGCDPAEPNLYKWSAGSLSSINAVPGARLGAQSGAVSADGNRVYWSDLAGGNLYLREGAVSKQVDAGAGGGGTFETATPDGATAFYTKAGHLWRYGALADSSVDLTPSGGVLGVLGASANASHVYYLTASGLFLRQGATTTKVADGADASNHPPTTGTARVSADGTYLLFVSTLPLLTSDGATYDNTELPSGAPVSQVYLYEATGAGRLACVSCNPTRARPLGPSSVPGAIANGSGPLATHSYKPRALAADGLRVFFESRDALVLSDVNFATDVYQWEAQGKGSCARPGGCVALISSGLSGSSTFVDASTEGSDAFFLTERSLVSADPGAIDLYDARVGGGFPAASQPSPCIGDACQEVPLAPQNPTLTTVLSGPGNPAERYYAYGAKARKRCPKGKRLKTVRKNGKKAQRCVKAGKPRSPKGKGGRR